MQPREPVSTGDKVKAIFEAAARVDGRAKMERSSENAGKELMREQEQQSQNAGGASGEPGVYIISVAARILSMHPQTLRKYERVGLVRPSRTVGMLRLYSEEDIAKLRMIKYLVDELRLNLAGVEMALAVFDRLMAARSQMKSSSPAASAKIFDQTVQDILALLQGQQPNTYREQR